jgi:hypothetical protein
VPLHNALRKRRKEKKKSNKKNKGRNDKKGFIACSKFKPATVKIGNVLYAMIYIYFFNFLTLCYWLASEEVFSIKWL